MISGDHYLPLTSKDWASAVCRTLPPAIRFSASPLQKTDPQNQIINGKNRPILLKNSIKLETCFSATCQTIVNFP
jgi:hypothetical protein